MDTTPVSLLERMRKPDSEDAWARFVDLATPMIHAWARRIGLSPTDTADLTQEVLLVLMQKSRPLSGETKGETAARLWAGQRLRYRRSGRGRSSRETRPTVYVGSTALMIWCEPAEAAEGACFIRDCVLSEGSLFLSSPGRDGKYPFTVVVERNWLRRDVGFMMGTPQGSFIIRRNFLEGLPSPGPPHNWGNINPVCVNGGAGRFEISNNTTADLGPPWSLAGPGPGRPELPTNAVVCNNIFHAPIRFDSAAYRWLPQARATWQLGHNLSLKWSSESDELMNAEDDVSDPSPFLSSDPSDADYLRVAADGIAAKSGAGGQWPASIGALPPGPAPKDGDWFTRLLQRWRKVHGESP